MFVSSPKIMAGVGTLGLNLLLMRYFSPSQFGVYSLCVATILLSDAILGSAFDFGVVRLASLAHSGNGRSLAVQRAALSIKLLSALLIAAVLVTAANPLSQAMFHGTGQGRLLYLTAATVVALLLFRSAQVQMQVAGRFRMYASFDLLHLVLKFGGVSVLIVAGWVTVRRTLLVFVLAPALTFVCWCGRAGRPLLRHLVPERAVAAELIGFVRWFLLTFSLANLLVRIDVFLLTRWATLDQVGIYAGGQLIAMIPQLLGTYLAVVLSPKIMPYWEAGNFGEFFRRYHLFALGVCGALYLGARFGLQTFAPILLPPSFLRSEQVILILLPGAIAGFLIFPVTIPFLMFLKPAFLFAMDAAALPFLLLAYRLAIASRGIAGAAWITSSYGCVKAVVALSVAWRWSSAHRTSIRAKLGDGVLPAVEVFEGGSLP